MMFKRIVIAVLLVSGVGFILYQPIVDRFILPHSLQEKYTLYTDVSPTEVKKNLKKLKESNEELFDFEDVDSVSANEIKNAILDKDYIIGAIYVPSVDLKLPILYGATHQNMLVGAGTLKPNQEMGKGNYAIASHNAKNPSILFAPIRNIEDGALMYMTDKEFVYVYQANYKEVIEPERIEVIEDGDKNELSLLSCYAADGSNRIIVKGEWLKTVPIEQVEPKLRNKMLSL